MYFFSILGEAVVRQDQITVFAGPFFDARADLPDKAIQSPIPLLHYVHSIVKEHVLDAIKVIENTGKHTLTKLIHQTIQNLNSSLKNLLTQIQELIIRDAAFFQPGCILRPTKREIRTNLLPESLCKGIRRGVMPGRMEGVDLQRQSINPNRAL